MSISTSDTELIAAFYNGEREAYQVIFDRFFRPLTYYIRQLIHDQLLIEDIAANAFVKTFERNTDFASVDKLKAFLFTTATNAVLDHNRNERRHKKVHEQISYLHADESEDIELAYIRMEAIRAIHEAIELLPSQTREVIRRLFVEGKRLQEIAAELNLSYNTVQNHRSRGLELLKIQLIKNNLISPAVLWWALSALIIH